MKIFCDSGIVDGRKDGKWTYYSISENGSRYAGELLKMLTSQCQGIELEYGFRKNRIGNFASLYQMLKKEIQGVAEMLSQGGGSKAA